MKALARTGCGLVTTTVRAISFLTFLTAYMLTRHGRTLHPAHIPALFLDTCHTFCAGQSQQSCWWKQESESRLLWPLVGVIVVPGCC